MAEHKQVKTLVVDTNEPFEVDDDAEIVDILVHGPRVKVFVLEPVTFTCGAPKQGGGQCEITVGGPDERCHHHE